MEATTENITAIMLLLNGLEFLPGYPRTELGLKACAKAICKTILQDQPHKEPPLTAMETAVLLFEKAAADSEQFPVPAKLWQTYGDLGFTQADKGPVDMERWKNFVLPELERERKEKEFWEKRKKEQKATPQSKLPN